jgi:DNA-binding response OmpR family regulator
MLADVGHIVVVDDDPTLRQMDTRFLEDHNVPAKSASNKTELNQPDSIDVEVLRLRRKLEIDPSAPRVIRTERGIGYVFALPAEPF